MLPLVSVVTATWQRHDLLLNRCIPSVQAQAYWPVEHVVVSDGPDPELRAGLLRCWHDPGAFVFDELPEHDPGVRWGVRARLRALDLAKGEYIAYLDDDDAWRPEHLALVAGALARRPEAGVAWGRAAVHFPDGTTGELGGEPAYGRLTTSMIVHRRSLLEQATWEDTELHDWALAEAWLTQGIRYVTVDAVTCDYYRTRPVEQPAAVLTQAGYQAQF